MLGIILMIVGGIVGTLGVWLLVMGVRKYDGYGKGLEKAFAGVFFIIITLCLLILIPACEYSSNLTLIHRLPAIERTIVERTALIANGDIGSGLEGMQMKQKIQDLLLEKNELLATYEVRQVSPWWIFKPKWIKEE